MVQNPNYVLNKLVSFKSDTNATKCKYNSDECVLELKLPVIKTDTIDTFLSRKKLLWLRRKSIES